MILAGLPILAQLLPMMMGQQQMGQRRTGRKEGKDGKYDEFTIP